VAEKVRQKKCGRKSVCGSRKSAAEKVRQKKCGRKSAAEKVRQKKCGRKSAEKVQQEKKKCGRKSAAGKVRQKKCSRKMAEKWQWIRGSKTAATERYKKKKRYGSHMCSVEFMNQVEGFPCKYVGCPLGSLWLVVELI
jgi:hypothetical protein